MSGSKSSVIPISGALGAEVLGAPSLERLDELQFNEIYQALLKHQVIFIRDQELSPQHYIKFAARFGAISRYPFAEGLHAHPEIVEIIKEPEQTSNFGGMWHTDTAYLTEPPAFTLLYAVETPPVGGDTVFSDMYLAYETLSEGMKAIVSQLNGVNSSSLNKQRLREEHLSSGSMREQDKDVFTAVHPAVRRHPETKRKSLYVNPSHTEKFAELTAEESRPILEYLFNHSISPELTCRFRWAPGTLAIWDNRCTLHCAINDYDGHRRVMQRITIAGEKPI